MNAVEVESLSKRYRLGGVKEDQYKTIRDSLSRLARFSRRAKSVRNEIWALRDVSFQVAEGEALGIVGRNGAGKSTLLKILSRITEPTSGRARLRGRVASLLEVGTGFHPELTGRENIFLNGSILGMKRSEILRDFDAIVAFAEIEKFLDTPVKRYSSGMYVRLAFAVAAHLTPEILIVDEVLAVGDAEFQKRCLGRMSEVARSGRTVLFVSHNLHAVENLCERAILLSGGVIEREGATAEVLAHYLSMRSGESLWDFRDLAEREGSGRAKITSVELLSADGRDAKTTLVYGESFRFRIRYEARERIQGPAFGIALLSLWDQRIFMTSTDEAGLSIETIEGEGFVDCLVMSPNILPGRYKLEVWVSDIPGVRFADHLRMVGKIEIMVGAMSRSTAGLSRRDRGTVFVPCTWSAETAEEVLSAEK